MQQRLAESTKNFEDYKAFNIQLAQLDLSKDDYKQVMESLTVRNLASDCTVILELLKSKVNPKDLEASLKFILRRGNQANDVRVVLALL